MSLVVSVPPSTMLADLDESVAELLRVELARHGYDRVEISFETPTREWAGTLSGPALNLFLYDMRESREHRARTVDERRHENGATISRPPLVLDCSYAISAWTKDVQDEHRLLSQTLQILFAFPRLPEEVLVGRLRDGSQRSPIQAKVGQARGEGKADFWTAIGGQYKASLDYVAMLTVEPGVLRERGPQVREQVVRVGDREGTPGLVAELHRIAGRVVDQHGEPQDGVWVALADQGRFAVTTGDGRFRLDRVVPGDHVLSVRPREGAERTIDVTIPGRLEDIVLDPAKVGGRRG